MKTYRNNVLTMSSSRPVVHAAQGRSHFAAPMV